MGREWYIIDNGVQRGPMPAHELRNYGLTSASMVWTQGMSDWMPAGQCAELMTQLGQAAGNEGYAQKVDPVGQSANPYGQPNNMYGQPNNMYGQPNNYGQPLSSDKSNIAAGLLAIFLGYLGIQYFYVGKVAAGFLTILLSLVTCGGWSVVTLIQGIYMLTLDQQQFDRKYVYSTSTFPIF